MYRPEYSRDSDINSQSNITRIDIIKKIRIQTFNL